MPLLIVLMLTAVATAVAQLTSRSRELLQLSLDVVPFVGVLTATVIAGARFRQASVPLQRLVLSIYGYFAGALVAALGVAHLVAVMVAAFDQAQRQQFVYSFRVYSMILLGVLLVATGLVATIQATRLAAGERDARVAWLVTWMVILGINLPLIPLQGFAVLFSVLAAVALLLLGGLRPR